MNLQINKKSKIPKSPTKKVPKAPSLKVMKGAFGNNLHQGISKLINMTHIEGALNPSKKYISSLETSRSQKIRSSFSKNNSSKSLSTMTYELLLNAFKEELLYIEAIKLEDNALAIAREIAKKLKDKEGEQEYLEHYNPETIQRLFNETIERKINQCERNLLNQEKNQNDLLIEKLKDILYTAHYGYAIFPNAIKNKSLHLSGGAPPSKSRANNKKQHSYYDSHEKEWHRHMKKPDDSLRKKIVHLSYRFIFPWKNLLSKVYKHLWYHFSLKKEEPESLPLRELNIKRLFLRDKIINSYPEGNDREQIRAAFDILESNEDLIFDINNSIWSRFLMDLRIKEYDKYPYEKRLSKQLIFIKKYQYKAFFPVHYIYLPFRYIPIYGIHFENKFDRGALLESMFYLLENVKNLTTFVDLQDCEASGGVSGAKSGCNPYDREAMREMFNLSVKVLTEQGIIENRERVYISIKYFDDMKAGSIYSWYQLSNIPPCFLDAHTGVHYSSAKGGTGIVLLFLRLRDAPKKSEISHSLEDPSHYMSLITEDDIIHGLKTVYFGSANILEVISKFKGLFKGLMLDFNNLKNRFERVDKRDRKLDEEEIFSNKIKEEDSFYEIVENDIFNIKFIWHIKLLRQRLNRIFYFLAKKHNITGFYLYTSPESSKFFQPTYDYKPVTINDIHELFSFPFKVSINWLRTGPEVWDIHQRWVDGIIDQYEYLRINH